MGDVVAHAAEAAVIAVLERRESCSRLAAGGIGVGLASLPWQYLKRLRYHGQERESVASVRAAANSSLSGAGCRCGHSTQGGRTDAPGPPAPSVSVRGLPEYSSTGGWGWQRWKSTRMAGGAAAPVTPSLGCADTEASRWCACTATEASPAPPTRLIVPPIQQRCAVGMANRITTTTTTTPRVTLVAPTVTSAEPGRPVRQGIVPAA